MGRVLKETAVPHLTSDIRYVVSEEGEPQAVILSLETFGRLMETLNVMSDQELMASIERARAQLQNGKSLFTHEELFGNL